MSRMVVFFVSTKVFYVCIKKKLLINTDQVCESQTLTYQTTNRKLIVHDSYKGIWKKCWIFDWVIFYEWNMIVLISLPSPSLRRQHLLISTTIHLPSLLLAANVALSSSLLFTPTPLVQDRRHVYKSFFYHPRQIENVDFWSSPTELAENRGQPGTKFQACKFGIVGKLNLCTITEKKPPSVHFGEKKLQGSQEEGGD